MMCLDDPQGRRCMVALVNVGQIPDITCEKLEEALPLSRRAITEKRRYPGRALSVAASSLVYWLLEQPPDGTKPVSVTAIPAESLTPDIVERTSVRFPLDWTADAHGKPFPDGVVFPGRNSRCFISLSHSGEWAAAALSSSPVGLDIQTVDKPPDQFCRTAKKIIGKFHPGEQAYLLSLNETGLTAAFPKWWAMKESVLKLCGMGLSFPLRSFCVTPFVSPMPFQNENCFDVYVSCLNGQSITIYSWFDDSVSGALAFYTPQP